MLKKLFAGTKWDVPCERCGKALSSCECPPPPEPAAPEPAPLAASAQKATIRSEKRKGKTVTTIEGLAAKDLDELLPRLKSLCGAGGTIKEGKLEVQGDQKKKVAAELEARGYRTRVI